MSEQGPRDVAHRVDPGYLKRRLDEVETRTRPDLNDESRDTPRLRYGQPSSPSALTEARFVAIETDVTALEAVDVAYDTRLDTLEATDISLDTRLDALEANRTINFSIPLNGGITFAGTPGFALQGSNTYYLGWAFDAAALLEALMFEFTVPLDYVSGMAVKLHWTNLGAGSGDVVWSCTVSWAAATENMNTPAHQVTGLSTVTAPGQNILKTSTHSITPTPSAGNSAYLIIGRAGSNVGDTLANDAGLVGLEITYTGSN